MRRRNGWFLCTLCLASVLCAQQPPAAGPQPAPGGPPGEGAPPPPQGRPRGGELDGGNLFRLVRQMDTNGDLLVEEKELNDGFRRFTEEAASMQRDLLAWLDKDKNGAISQEEWKPFYTIMSLLPVVRSADQNGDLVLQDPELDTAFGRMAEFCQSSNDRTLQQFDRNHDGKLAEDELQAARQAMQRFGMRGPGGGPGAGGPPQPGPGAPPPAAGGAAAPPPAAGAAR